VASGQGDLDDGSGVSATDAAATLLFSEIDDATSLWERYPDGMSRAVREYHDLLAKTVEAHNGRTVTQLGDSVHAVFADAGSAVRCAIDTQVELLTRVWRGTGALRARMGLHTGLLQWGRSEVFGPAVTLAARLEAAANGGQILLSEATAQQCGSHLEVDERLQNLGPRTLPGVYREVTIYEVVSERILSGQPLWLVPGGYESIPMEQTRLIGRDSLIDEVLRVIRDERLVTLCGPAGIGKSRVAIRVAARSRSPFEDGVRFIDASVVSDPTQLPDAILTILHGTPLTGEPVADAVVRILVPQRLLLVIDNCDHLLTGIRSLVRTILDHCPWVHVLATSRERLVLRGEHQVAVPLLSLPPPDAKTLATIGSNAAVRLFVDRARMADGHFALRADNAAVVFEICNRTGGLPLAIELAAGRMDVETADELAVAETGARLGAEGSGEDDEDRAVRILKESFDLLAPLERRLFLCLSVFAGSFTRDMGLDLIDAAGRPAERRAFDRLIRGSMINRESPGSSRFRLFDPARELASTLLTKQELEDLRRRHAALMLARAETFGPLMRTRDEPRAVPVLRADFADHRQAVAWLLDHDAVDETARLIAAVFPFCLFQLLSEVFIWADRLAPRMDSQALAAEILGIAALGAWFKGDPDWAIELGERALASQPSHESSLFWAEQALFNAFQYTGRGRDGIKHFMRFVAESTRSDDPFWQITGLGFESIGWFLSGRNEEATECAERAVSLARRLNNPDCTHWALHCLGRSLAETDPEGACEAFEEASASARRVGSRWNLSLDLIEWSALKRQLGDLRDAAGGLVELLDLLSASGNRSQLAETFFEAARVLTARDEAEAAFLLVTARQGMMEMPRGPREVIVDDEFVSALEAAVGTAQARLSVRGRTMSEQDVIILCRSALEEIARGRVGTLSHNNRRLEDVTIVYTDLVASTELNVQVGDERWLELMREHDSIVRHRLARFGGTEFTHTGDGVGAFFDDADEAVRFAVGLQADFDDANASHPDAALRVRVGIARGEALENEGNLFGQTVVRAVRICAIAEAAKVLVGEDVTTTANPTTVRFVPFGSVPLKGFGTKVLLFEAASPR
jgi:class 3 adenylate cyclase/predicted ATPase